MQRAQVIPRGERFWGLFGQNLILAFVAGMRYLLETKRNHLIME